MRFKFTFLTIFLLFVSLQTVIGQTQEREQRKRSAWIGTFPYEIGKQKYKITLTEDDIKDTPSWNALSGETIPLTIENAVRIAQEELKKVVTNTDGWELISVNLHKAPIEQKWYYELHFRNFKTSDYYFCIVKLDGSVVEPFLDEESKDQK